VKNIGLRGDFEGFSPIDSQENTRLGIVLVCRCGVQACALITSGQDISDGQSGGSKSRGRKGWGASAAWAVVLDALRTGIAAIASVPTARLFRMQEAYWAPITTLVIVQSSLGAALTASWQRFLGTALGHSPARLWLLRTAGRCIRVSVFLLGLICALARGSERLSFRGNYAGDCIVDSADVSGVADCFSSLRRSVHRDWGGVDIGGGVARERSGK
jgi:hypothetical protein